MPGDFDPNFSFSRQMLALSIINKLEDSKFINATPEKEKKAYRQRPMTWQQERIYERAVDPQGLLKVKVYTTVVGGTETFPLSVRHRGKDAIRVCGTYRTRLGKERGIVKEKRVNRTGNIEDIVERMLERMREVWKALKTGDSCSKCGAPMFVSKAGNKVCSEICWKTEKEKKDNERQYKKKKTTRRSGWK